MRSKFQVFDRFDFVDFGVIHHGTVHLHPEEVVGDRLGRRDYWWQKKDSWILLIITRCWIISTAVTTCMNTTVSDYEGTPVKL